MTLTRADLWSLEQYAEKRADFRREVIAHKQNRQVAIGPHARLYFEDAITIRYQIQEMLRIERIFEAAGIQEELDAYNPLIPNGQNLKATFMLEYTDVEERKAMLAKLKGVEDKVWVKAGDSAAVYAIADEDLERENDEKTSSVHFLRFELPGDAIESLHRDEPLIIGIDHELVEPNKIEVSAAVRKSLTSDLKRAH